MKRSIRIEKVGVPQVLANADRIWIKDENGDSTEWVPLETTKTKEKTITENGTYKAEDDGVYAYSKVNVDVRPKLGTKYISENGSYYANDDGLDAYSNVVVNVPVPTGIEFKYSPDCVMPSSGNIHYDGAVVVANYSDGTQVDVTSQCTFDPPEGTPISSLGNDPIKLTAYWSAGGNT